MFNPRARWDRDLPSDLDDTESLHEPIKLACVFSVGTPAPRFFIWKKRLYKVKKVLFYWQKQEGRELLSYFSLETNAGIYQVYFSHLKLTWKISKFSEQ